MVLLFALSSFCCYFKTGIFEGKNPKTYLHNSIGVSLWAIKNSCVQVCAKNGFTYLQFCLREAGGIRCLGSFCVCLGLFSVKPKNHNMSTPNHISLSFLNLAKRRRIKQAHNLWGSDIESWYNLVVDVSLDISFLVLDKNGFFWIFLFRIYVGHSKCKMHEVLFILI